MLRHVPGRETDAWVRRYHQAGIKRGPLIKIILIAAFAGFWVHDAFVNALRFPTLKAGAAFIVVTECRQPHIETSGYLHEVGVLRCKVVLVDINTPSPHFIE